MNKSTLLLHLGLAKTGTATLQRALFLKHPQVHYLGKIVGVKNNTKEDCLDDTTYKILEPILWDLNNPMNT